MTKTELIRQLYDGRRSVAEIADAVGCHPAYVRVVARQRAKGTSKAQYNYRPRCNELNRRKYKAATGLFGTGVGMEAGRRAYRRARASGQSAAEARTAYASAYAIAIRRLYKLLKSED